MKHKAQFGSVSHGTMRAEDLIPRFANELDYLAGNIRENFDLIMRASALPMDDDCYYLDDEEVQDVLNRLFDALDNLAPPYAYFGAYPGDGSDYGFWLSDDLAENFDGWIIDDSQKGAGEPPADYCGEILHINDHGNTSLLVQQDGKREIIWAVV